VLDNIRSAYNVGSFFRTADAAGGAMLHLCGITPYPPNPKLDKTALGALESVSWMRYATVTDAVSTLRLVGIPVFAVELTDTSVDYRSIPYPTPSAFVFGHELHGVNDFALNVADAIVHIPMQGKKSSLNVATVAGIIVFEALRASP